MNIAIAGTAGNEKLLVRGRSRMNSGALFGHSHISRKGGTNASTSCPSMHKIKCKEEKGMERGRENG